jgi:hypothetical protein
MKFDFEFRLNKINCIKVRYAMFAKKLNIYSSFLAPAILVSTMFLPNLALASNFDYDGKWSVNLACGKLIVQGNSPAAFTQHETWIIENGRTKYTRLGANESTTSWTIEIKDKKISLSGYGTRVSASWQWKMNGEFTNDKSFNLKGEMYSNGNRIRDCSGIGSLVTASERSLAGKKLPDQVASVNQTTPSAKPIAPSTKGAVPTTQRITESNPKPTSPAVQVTQNNAQVGQGNIQVAQSNAPVGQGNAPVAQSNAQISQTNTNVVQNNVQNNTNLVQNNTKVIQNNTQVVQNNSQIVAPPPKESPKESTIVVANINVANDTKRITSNSLDNQKKTSSNEVWVSFDPSIPLQQRQFCRIVENFRTELVISKATKNDIKVNETYRNLMQSLTSLLPDGKFQGWLMRTVRVGQERDGSADVLLQLPCNVLVGSNTCGNNPNNFTGIVPEDSRIYTELAKMTIGDFAITNGQFIYSDDKVFDRNRSVASFQYMPASSHCKAKEFKTNPDFFGVKLDTLSTIK